MKIVFGVILFFSAGVNGEETKKVDPFVPFVVETLFAGILLKL